MGIFRSMTMHSSISLSIAAAFIGLFIAVLLVYLPTTNQQNAYAQLSSPDNNNKTLFTTGSATTQVKPDKVTVSLGVETTNTKAKAALAANSELMNKIINALRITGVKENETSTSSFTITPNRDYTVDKSQGRLIGFTVSNSIQIDSNNVNKTSDWIDTAVSSGANNVNSIYFSLSDKKLDNIKKQLLNEAIENAKEKADIAASALGLKIVGIRTVTIDQPTPIFTGPTSYGAQSVKSEAVPSTPIMTGEQQISQSVNIVYLMG